MAQPMEAFRSLIVFDPLRVDGDVTLNQPPSRGSVRLARGRDPHRARQSDRPYCCRIVSMLVLVGAACLLVGCKATVTEVRGKTSFGPEFRNRGNNTSEVRYAFQQGVEARWDNGWTTGMTYRRRDVDEGSGDNENRVLFEVGYPIWKAPKKPDKTAERLEELEHQVAEMRSRVAGARAGEPDVRVAASGAAGASVRLE